MKRAALITDISGLGNCSANASIAVMAALGVETCLVPTAVLSAQTGFPSYYCKTFGEEFAEYIDSLKIISPRFDAIYIGFLNTEDQCECALSFIDALGRGAAIVADPICGDKGKRFPFVTDGLLDGIRRLAERADVVTPNLTELCLLTDGDCERVSDPDNKDRMADIETLCRKLTGGREKTVIVTGIDRDDELTNLVCTGEGLFEASAKRYGGSLSGTGDIFTSVICAAAAKGEDLAEAALTAARFISETSRRTADEITDRNYGLPFQPYLSDLMNAASKKR